MRQDNKSYLFKPQDLLDLYYKLVNRFLQEEVEECKEQLSDQIIDTFIEIIDSPFEEIKWHEVFMEYLCHNESVLSSFLEHQVDVYRNNDVEWNYRYIEVFFAALEYPASPKMIHKLFSALPNYKDIIMDLIEFIKTIAILYKACL